MIQIRKYKKKYMKWKNEDERKKIIDKMKDRMH